MFDVFLKFQECIFGKFSFKTELDIVPFVQQYIVSSLRKKLSCSTERKDYLIRPQILHTVLLTFL